MERSYQIVGMTCTGCTQIVHDLLSNVPGVRKVQVDLKQKKAVIEMQDSISVETLKSALSDSLYELTDEVAIDANHQQKTVIDELGRIKKLVSDYVTAAGKMDAHLLSQFLSNDFEFDGAIHLHTSGDYLKMVEEHAQSGTGKILVGNDIKAIFIDGNEACVIYDVVTKTSVEPIPFFEQIIIEEDKIAATKVKFSRNRMKMLMKEIREGQQEN